MSPPYELSYVSGRLAVNGFALVPPKQSARRQYHYSPRERAQIAFGQRAADLSDSLRAKGATREEIGEALRSMCLSSPLVDSVTVWAHGVTWRYHDGQRFSVELAGKWVPPAHPVTREQMEMHDLEQIRRLLEKGATIFFLDSGRRVEAIESPETMVAQALAGELGSTLEAQLRSPIPLERVK